MNGLAGQRAVVWTLVSSLAANGVLAVSLASGDWDQTRFVVTYLWALFWALPLIAVAITAVERRRIPPGRTVWGHVGHAVWTAAGGVLVTAVLGMIGYSLIGFAVLEVWIGLEGKDATAILFWPAGDVLAWSAAAAATAIAPLWWNAMRGDPEAHDRLWAWPLRALARMGVAVGVGFAVGAWNVVAGVVTVFMVHALLDLGAAWIAHVWPAVDEQMREREVDREPARPG